MGVAHTCLLCHLSLGFVVDDTHGCRELSRERMATVTLC